MDQESKPSVQSVDGEMVAKKSSSSSNGVMWFIELVIRVLALGGTLAAAIVVGRDKQTVNVFGVALKAKYTYSAAFVFFVVANAIACVYVFLSLPFALLKPKSHVAIKFVVFFLDLVMVALVMAGASAATAIAYVGHKGNSHTKWSAICNPFDRFCDHIGGALVASFISFILFMLLTIISAVSLYKHSH
ncbi:hypothetical protein SUGI_0990760 [Cryptomeria japonica]|uniref:CASP-like protein 1U1 n=1 Tax=Cryptomeria japonica TaxID=3369 RepID=UPI00241474B4|nr:CASP-like protein 1U1 [Cryptomeria japonica]GLJ46949.1 hypothetical protein SUGI_0990760 [Cryptomeria japonica]